MKRSIDYNGTVVNLFFGAWIVLLMSFLVVAVYDAPISSAQNVPIGLMVSALGQSTQATVTASWGWDGKDANGELEPGFPQAPTDPPYGGQVEFAVTLSSTHINDGPPISSERFSYPSLSPNGLYSQNVTSLLFGMDSGRYILWARNIDLAGNTSEWSLPSTPISWDDTPPGAPGNVTWTLKIEISGSN